MWVGFGGGGGGDGMRIRVGVMVRIEVLGWDLGDRDFGDGGDESFWVMVGWEFLAIVGVGKGFLGYGGGVGGDLFGYSGVGGCFG